MSDMTSQITNNSIPSSSDCKANNNDKIKAPHNWALCEGNDPLQMDSPHKGQVMQKAVYCN